MLKLVNSLNLTAPYFVLFQGSYNWLWNSNGQLNIDIVQVQSPLTLLPLCVFVILLLIFWFRIWAEPMPKQWQELPHWWSMMLWAKTSPFSTTQRKPVPRTPQRYVAWRIHTLFSFAESVTIVLYSGQLSRKKTFTNFVVLEPPTKVFSTKFGCTIPTCVRF